jgi:pimeloyl-ACP methyl ester carboxylesterase
VRPQTARDADRPYRWRMIGGAGHCPHEEQPEILDTELLGWLADPEPER